MNKIYLGADHAGFKAKEKLKKHLSGYSPVDLTPEYKEGDDYPDVAFKVAEKVRKDKHAMGILICGTGAGMVIAANKVKGIRAVEAYDKKTAELSREHNDTNMLALSGWNKTEKENNKIVDTWLKSDFSNEERHRRRISKISKYELK
ncbi:MAG: RpiB/LacA/LacB family sugar-phosphate isomerase [Nanoarchaeota archaeon]